MGCSVLPSLFCNFSYTYSDIHWLLQLILSIYNAWFSDIRFGLDCSFFLRLKSFLFPSQWLLELVAQCDFLQHSHLFSSASFYVPPFHFTRQFSFSSLSLTHINRFHCSIMKIFLRYLWKGLIGTYFLPLNPMDVFHSIIAVLCSSSWSFFALLEAQNHKSSFNNC